MTQLLLIKAVATALHATFFRLGRAWPKEGTVVAEGDFTPEEWSIIAAEPMLHIAPAPEEAEVAAAEGEGAIVAIKAAIAGLSAEDFDAQGKPKVAALRAALPDIAITAALRDAAWAEVSPAPAA